MKLQFDIAFMDVVHTTREIEFLEVVQQVYPHAELVLTPNKRYYIYVDNQSPILGICHLDGTMSYNKPELRKRTTGEKGKKAEYRYYSTFVDDRSGVYALLHLLPQVGVVTDLLFTTDEEKGMSTGRYFTPKRHYNWMYQFDRKGTDAVYYMYRGKEWLEALRKHFGHLDPGIASDICKMNHMGIQGVNIGTGYHDYTSSRGYTSLNELSQQVRRFQRFFDEFHEQHFQWEDTYYSRPGRLGGYQNIYEMEEEDDDEEMERGEHAVTLNVIIENHQKAKEATETEDKKEGKDPFMQRITDENIQVPQLPASTAAGEIAAAEQELQQEIADAAGVASTV